MMNNASQTICYKSGWARLLLGIIMLVAVLFSTVMTGTNSVNAADVNTTGGTNCDAGGFLGFPHWYRGLCEGGTIKLDGKDVGTVIFTVVLNCIDIVLRIVGILAVGMMIYGGVRYLISQGTPDKVAAAKDTIIKALAGLVIASLSATLVGFAVGRMGGTGNGSIPISTASADTLLTNVLNAAFFIIGAAAVIIIIVMGIKYMASNGDPTKAKTARMGIVYAVVGLAVSIAAYSITNFVVGKL